MVDWVGTDDPNVKNAQKIKVFLREKIVSAQKTLLGEIDLNEDANYAGNNWSLKDFSDYLISKDVIKGRIGEFVTNVKIEAARFLELQLSVQWR